MEAMSLCRIVGASGLALAALAAAAQSRPPTTEQLGRDPGALRQEAEQQRSRDMQQQQQQSQQQADQHWNDTVRQNQSRVNADANIAATRRSLEQRPALPPEKNPLLGRWESLGAAQRGGGTAGLPPELAKMAADLVGGMTAGMCDNMVSRGTIEFRPGGVYSLRDGRERMLYRAEYRSNGAQVVVLPMGGTTFNWMYIDFHGRDRAQVSQVGCNLTRAGPATATAAMTNTSLTTADAGPAPKWVRLGGTTMNGGIDLYVAPSTIRRTGDRVQILELFDFKTRQMFEGKAFLSARNLTEYDCPHKRQRMLGTTGYAGPMGNGAVIAADHATFPWKPVEGELGLEQWKVACQRQ